MFAMKKLLKFQISYINAKLQNNGKLSMLYGVLTSGAIEALFYRKAFKKGGKQI